MQPCSCVEAIIVTCLTAPGPQCVGSNIRCTQAVEDEQLLQCSSTKFDKQVTSISTSTSRGGTTNSRLSLLTGMNRVS